MEKFFLARYTRLFASPSIALEDFKAVFSTFAAFEIKITRKLKKDGRRSKERIFLPFSTFSFLGSPGEGSGRMDGKLKDETDAEKKNLKSKG